MEMIARLVGTKKGRDLIYVSLQHPMRNRQEHCLGDQADAWEFLPQDAFWEVIEDHTKTWGCSPEDAIIALCDKDPDPTRVPPHLFLREVS